jgi:hypothetical protein
VEIVFNGAFGGVAGAGAQAAGEGGGIFVGRHGNVQLLGTTSTLIFGNADSNNDAFNDIFVEP